MPPEALRQAILSWLAPRSPQPGQTVEFSWFVLRVIQEPGGRLNLQTLDFLEMASFTTDFSRVAAIHEAQNRALEEHSLEACACTNRHAAMVSHAYYPGHPRAEMFRISEAEGSDSGWYLGVAGEPSAIDNPQRVHFASTYELTIHDHRLAPYWLFPVGYVIAFSQDGRAAVQTRQLPVRKPDPPWWKFW